MTENNSPRRYRKLPVEIEAMHFDGTQESALAIVGWSQGMVGIYTDGGQQTDPLILIVATEEGNMMAAPHTFIICGVAGEFYPCAPEIFAASYEEVG